MQYVTEHYLESVTTGVTQEVSTELLLSVRPSRLRRMGMLDVADKISGGVGQSWVRSGLCI